MSIAILTQVADEVRRLAIAGSVVAPGDFRLKKLAPALEKAGEKAPVFAKVAQGVNKVIESNEQTSAESLLELSSLVNAILYTQGETGIAGTLAEIPTTNLGNQQTQTSARILKPLLEALSTTGSGRMEVIKDAHERNVFKDLRLIKPVLQGLDDPYPEIADFLVKSVLPLYGTAIVPELRAKFDQKGRAGHCRRLQLMHQLDPVGTRPLVQEALEQGSKEMRVTAIECLGDSPEDLAFLLEQAKAKAKDVRAAALRALAKLDAGDAGTLLQSVLKSGELELVVQSIRRSPNPQLRTLVLEETKAQLAQTLAAKPEKDKEKAKKEAGARHARLNLLLECLRGHDDAAISAFLLDAFETRDKLATLAGEPSGKDVAEKMVQLMAQGSDQTRRALAARHADLSADDLRQAFFAARYSLSAAEVYDTFAPYLRVKVDPKKKGRDAAASKFAAVLDGLQQHWSWYRYGDVLDEEEFKNLKSLDPRWLDLAVEQEHLSLVMALARPGHATVNGLLSRTFVEVLGKSKDLHDIAPVLQTMIRVEHPDATQAMLQTIEKHAKTSHHWGFYWISRLIPQLPKSAVGELEQLLPKLPEKVIDQLLDYVTQLKNRT
jgi:hypothetical protein